MTDGRKARSCFAAFLFLASTVALIASLCAVAVGPVEEHLAPVVAALRRPRSWRTDLRVAGALALGMASIVGPYTLRNLALTGRLVPVCAQGGFALWGSSVAKPAPGEPYVTWVRIWREQGMPIFARVTGSSEYSIERLTQHALPLDEAFSRAAMANIRRDPGNLRAPGPAASRASAALAGALVVLALVSTLGLVLAHP
jgi:hypothetical protein